MQLTSPSLSTPTPPPPPPPPLLPPFPCSNVFVVCRLCPRVSSLARRTADTRLRRRRPLQPPPPPRRRHRRPLPDHSRPRRCLLVSISSNMFARGLLASLIL